MVAARSFLIDATFLLEDAEAAFLGAAAIVDSHGRNNSIVYGAIRDMLRLRRTLGIVSGVIIVGAEAATVSTTPNIENFVNCLRALGTYVLHEPGASVGTLCRSILKDRKEWWIVTRDKALMQLVGTGCGIIMTAEGVAPEPVTVERLAADFGIRPDQVPSFLSLTLTEVSSGASLSRKQAVRLLEVHGTLHGIFGTSDVITAPPKIKKHLIANKVALLGRSAELTIKDGDLRAVPTRELVRHDDDSKRKLNEYGFPSLSRLLARPAQVDLVPEVNDREPAYVAVVDREGLRELTKAISSADVCAIDTESSGKDPRKASLFGVAFSVREGHASYVPIIQADLREISTDSVLKELRRLLAKPVKIVGHNLKYDYVLLRRYGIQIAVPYFDTMLAAHECFGDWDFFNLGSVAKRLLGKEIKRYRDLVEDGQTLLDVPFKDLVEHGCADADMALRLHGHLLKTLIQKGIEDQFTTNVMPLMRLLGDRECSGLRVNSRAIARRRDVLAKEIATAQAAIFAKVGKQFDLDSLRDIETALKGIDGIRERISRQSLRQNQLEQLAQSSDVVRQIVQWQRIQKQMKQLETICKGEKQGKVFPLFSQVKSPHGSIWSSDPKLFDPRGGVPASAVLDRHLRQLIPDENRSLDILQSLTADRVLKRDRRLRQGKFIIGDESVLAGLNHAEVVISIAIGLPNASLCKRLLIDPRRAAILRELIVGKYPKLFEWLDDFRKKVLSERFASLGTRRRYWDGLGSSDIERRNKALQSAVRWLIEM
jgi:DNA polymerase-1